MQKWSSYIKGDPKRQEILEVALDWVSSAAGHQRRRLPRAAPQDTDITGLKTYFTSVIDWIGSVFTRPPDKEMRGLDWGRLYETLPLEVVQRGRDRRRRRRAPRRPGGAQHQGHLRVPARWQDGPAAARRPAVRREDEGAAYEQQTQKAKADGVSNCPLCALGDNANKTRIYKLNEMDADHVTAWSKGGATDLENCEMLCVTHNRAKGNR